ncbi:putative MscS family protein YkuT [Paenibacillus polymyxa E681]|uniref:mechanosensitive ion channel family protein n=1 Tax=Paenibacillus polymyxa TaxID=1406 RepID=UPI0001E32280|nr:mechanosensitive ion channel family protein [Paenibacillus polymyxa]ADM72698.1 mechanosensitive ion channel protein MscS [Paenibacillus polymyxa E681]QNV59725.1 putative MscS family protein YkuT [Paenibacillus polymyxa E681]QNV64551.1 putative MscS family protein YkuT [Paenibacillus polymyxa E681]
MTFIHWLAGNLETDDVVKGAIHWKDVVWNWLTDSAMWSTFLFVILKIAIIFIITRIFIRVINKIIDKSMQRKGDNGRFRLNTRRLTTVGELLKNVTNIVFNFILIMLVLSQMGINLGPLIAGAGVLGLAVGFGAQSLVKDVITGFFIIFEDQFAVGDVIQTGTFKGTVEMIGLRTTRLVSWKGEVYILPNGSITTVTNFSMSNALAVVDVPMKAERSLEEAVGLVKQAIEGIEESNVQILNIPDVLGVQSMTTSEYIVRVVAECMPNTGAVVERDIQNNIKKALEDEEHRQAALETSITLEKEDEQGRKGGEKGGA